MANGFLDHVRINTLRPSRLDPTDSVGRDGPDGPYDDAQNAPYSIKSYTVHRLQVGLSGLVGVVVIIALADTILSRADQSEASAVPEAAATVQVDASPVPQNDPLAEAGVVPASPAPTETASATQALPPPSGTSATRPGNAPN
ncbi:MAG: hypothetical protein WA954_07645 [Parerythrobacter sp.]